MSPFTTPKRLQIRHLAKPRTHHDPKVTGSSPVSGMTRLEIRKFVTRSPGPEHADSWLPCCDQRRPGPHGLNHPHGDRRTHPRRPGTVLCDIRMSPLDRQNRVPNGVPTVAKYDGSSGSEPLEIGLNRAYQPPDDPVITRASGPGISRCNACFRSSARHNAFSRREPDCPDEGKLSQRPDNEASHHRGRSPALNTPRPNAGERNLQNAGVPDELAPRGPTRPLRRPRLQLYERAD